MIRLSSLIGAPLVIVLAACSSSNDPPDPTPPLNAAPTANFSVSPSSGIAPFLVAVDASSSRDSDGSITSYAWDFGDGATGSGVTATHEYQIVGLYSVRLTVTDNDGANAAA